MRTIIHLHTNDSEESVFYQLVDEDINVKVGELFNYSDKYYYQLGNKAKQEFEAAGLSIGNYKVISAYLEPSIDSKEKYIFIRPIQE